MSTQRGGILIITDQLPYPPRNGATLPVFNYAQGLARTQPVKVCLMVDGNADIDIGQLEQNTSLFGEIEIIRFERRPNLVRALMELAGREMYQHGWYRVAEVEACRDLHVRALIVSPMSAVAKWQASGLAEAYPGAVTIAAVSDCTAAEYYFRGLQSFGGVKNTIKGLSHRVRSTQIAKIESRLLARYDHVLLQTSKDRQLMSELVSDETASRVEIVPNGVRAELFELIPDPENRIVLFVAELSGEYAPIAEWVIGELWPKVLAVENKLKLVVVGKGASPSFKQAVAGSERATHHEYVENLGDLYGKAAMAISPIFKGYGLINKTLEAMAASVPVVGGAAAFNGIENFVSGVHGVVCTARSSAEFAQAIIRLGSDTTIRMAIGCAGRELVRTQFKWESAIEKLCSLIDAADESPGNAKI